MPRRWGEVPVGAVVAKDGVPVGHGAQHPRNQKNATHHAELLAIDAACKALGGWRLWQCELFVTLEPCPMCSGAIINSRVKRVVYGAPDPKAGCCGSGDRPVCAAVQPPPCGGGGLWRRRPGRSCGNFCRAAAKAEEKQ